MTPCIDCGRLIPEGKEVPVHFGLARCYHCECKRRKRGLALIVAASLMLASCYPVKIVGTPAMTDRVIYIIGVEEYQAIDKDDPVFVLGYTINGAFQDPPFRSRESVDQFVDHLRTLGEVIEP